MNINYMAIVQPMRIYPHEIQRIITVLETLLWPEDEIDQGVMFVITAFLKNKLKEYNEQQDKEFSSMCVGTWTSSDGVSANGPGTETNTEVTISPDFPYPEGTAEKNRAKKKSKKRGKKNDK